MTAIRRAASVWRRRARDRRLGALAACLLAVSLGDPRAGLASEPPDVVAEASIVVDARTGTMIAADHAYQRRPIASTTKLMTALLTIERAEPRDVFEASDYEPESFESQLGFLPGERMAVRDLLAALLLESANDAAVTLAEGVEGSTEEFVDEMNARADRLGLEDTSYENPIGFDHPDNHSTASDLAELGARLMRIERFSDIVEEPRIELRSGARPRTVENRNDLVGTAPAVDGVKTGFTLGAGHVLVGSAERDGARVVSVVLGAPDEDTRDDGTLALLDYGLDRYVDRRVLTVGRAVARAEVAGGGGEQVALAPAEGVSLPVLRGERVETRIDAPAELRGPLPADEEVGTVAVVRAGEVVERVPVVTAAAVPAPSTLATLREEPLRAAGLAVALVCVAAASVVALARLRRRGSGARSTTDRPSA